MDIVLLKILFCILCFQFLFVTLFLFQNKKGRSLSNRLLAIVFLMISIVIANLYSIVFRVEVNMPQLLLFDDTFMFAYGPLLYLFTQSVLFKDYRFKKKHIVHFIPFLISIGAVLCIILFVGTESLSQVAGLLSSQQVPIYFHIGGILMLAHVFYYLFKSKLEIKEVLGKVKCLYSTFNQDNFKLLKFVLNGFIILFVLSLIHSTLPFVGVNGGLLITLLLMVLFMFYFINSILLKLLNQASNDNGVITQINFKEKEKYVGSSLSKTDLNAYVKRLKEHMEDNKRFLDSELSISDLSRELEIPTKILSQVINEGYTCNFFDFVNEFRIETAKSILTNQSDQKMTIQEVMYDSGFNSKSSFNTAFKKFTNLTPTQFKNSIQKGSTS